mgnify:CR=1 FL=1
MINSKDFVFIVLDLTSVCTLFAHSSLQEHLQMALNSIGNRYFNLKFILIVRVITTIVVNLFHLALIEFVTLILKEKPTNHLDKKVPLNMLILKN